MESKILALREELGARLAAATDTAALDEVRVAFLGKRGYVTELLKGLRDLPAEEKREAGGLINRFKTEAEEAIAAAQEALAAAALLDLPLTCDMENVDENIWLDKLNFQPLIGRIGGVSALLLLNCDSKNSFLNINDNYRELLEKHGCTF